jgi:hypothetical protein
VTVRTPPKSWVWWYRPTGKERHLLAHPADYTPVCGSINTSAAGWLGAGSLQEQDKLLCLPMCRRCLRRQAEEL